MKVVVSARIDQTLLESLHSHYVSKGIIVGSKSQLLSLALHDLAERLTEEGFTYRKQSSPPSYQISDVLSSQRLEHVSAKREITSMLSKLKGASTEIQDTIE